MYCCCSRLTQPARMAASSCQGWRTKRICTCVAVSRNKPLNLSASAIATAASKPAHFLDHTPTRFHLRRGSLADCPRRHMGRLGHLSFPGEVWYRETRIDSCRLQRCPDRLRPGGHSHFHVIEKTNSWPAAQVVWPQSV